MNFLEASVVEADGGVFLDFGGFRLRVPADLAAVARQHVGETVVFGIRPEDLHDRNFAKLMQPDATVTARVEVREAMGSDLFLYATVGGLTIHARVNPATKVEVGQAFDVHFDLTKMHLFDRSTGLAII